MATGGIGRRLFIGVAALTVLVLVASGVSIWVGATMKSEFDQTARGVAWDLAQAREIEFDAISLHSEQRRLLLSALGADAVGLREAKATLQSSRASVAQHLQDIQTRPMSDATRMRVASTTEKLKAWDVSAASILQLVDAGDASAAWNLMRTSSAPLLDGVRADTDAMTSELEATAARSLQAADEAYSFMWWLQVAMLVLSLPVTLAVALSVRRIANTLRAVSANLGESAEHVASAAAQVAAASQELSKGANEQASSIGDTSGAMIKMADSVRRNAESSTSVATMTSEASMLIDTANNSLRGMVSSMTAIKASSDKVARIIKTIDEIAFQTNILALNAAVEAARAGEAGMGFAVVADEVRNLAQRSAHAAKDTATLIEESIARAEEGHERVEQVAQSVAAVSASANRIQHVIEGVSATSRDQSAEIEHVMRAVSEIERVTQSTAASAEEHAAVGQEISAQAAAAMAAVRRLTTLVEGGAHAAGRPSPLAPMPLAHSRVVSMLSRRAPHAADAPAEHEGPATGTFGRF